MLSSDFYVLLQPGTKKGWWNALPNWWESQSEAVVYDKLKAQDSKAKAAIAIAITAPDAWWLGTEYHGYNYALKSATTATATSTTGTAR